MSDTHMAEAVASCYSCCSDDRFIFGWRAIGDRVEITTSGIRGIEMMDEDEA
jgi:hypothetical protein